MPDSSARWPFTLLQTVAIVTAGPPLLYFAIHGFFWLVMTTGDMALHAIGGQ